MIIDPGILAVDLADERWGCNDPQAAATSPPGAGNRHLTSAWRCGVVEATDASTLMSLELLLEYGIKASWLKPQALKLLSCLPSRSQALRTATLAQVATRLWALDQVSTILFT